MLRTVICVLGILQATTPAVAQEVAESRAALVTALERLMIAGEPHQTTLDDGQLLQLGVDEAIRQGDAEIERLAVRAATPIVAAVISPLIPIGRPISLGVGNRQVLTVPRPIPFTAIIYLSVDGHPYQPAGTVTSTKGSSVSAKLPDAALTPGVHHIRVRARMTFGDSRSRRWTEARQLPDVAYAVYDPSTPGTGFGRLQSAPAAINADVLDERLPGVPLATWLASVLARVDAKRPVEWMTQYCVERKQKIVSPPRGGGDLCAVAYFEAKGDIFRVWFRTGSVRFKDAGPVWTVDRPSFEGIDTAQSGTALTTLSALPALLDTARESWPTADLAIAATDIVLETPRPDWAIIAVTVRNNGPVAVHRAQVIVVAGSDPARRGIPRILTVDVPANGSAEVKVGSRLPAAYGFVVAQAIQISDMSPHDTWTFDLTPLDACACRLFNAHLAPAEYVRAIDRSSGCVGW